jgi:hypothetical protein
MESNHRKEHRPWRPRMRGEHEFNPFVRMSDSGMRFDHQSFKDFDLLTDESRGQETDLSPTASSSND